MGNMYGAVLQIAPGCVLEAKKEEIRKWKKKKRYILRYPDGIIIPGRGVAYNGKVSAFCSELELIKILESYLPPVSVIMEFRGEEENK